MKISFGQILNHLDLFMNSACYKLSSLALCANPSCPFKKGILDVQYNHTFFSIDEASFQHP